MSEEEIRVLVSVIQQQRVSPQTRRSKAKKTSDVLSGKKPKAMDISDLL